MRCPQCHAECQDGKNFCSDCGVLLAPQLIPLIRSQVEEYVQEHYRDQSVVEIKTSEAVADRVLKWARLYYAIPIAVLVIILALLGIGDYADFHKTVRRATDELKPKLNQAINEADTAFAKAQDAESRSDAGTKAIEAATAKMKAQLASAQQLSTTVNGLETRTASQIASASKHVEDRLTELDKKLEAANKTIAEQQAKLTSTNELVRAMFSQGRTEIFPTFFGDAPNVVTIPSPAGRQGAQVFMLLKGAPILQTVQVQFYVAVEPRYSYSVNANIVSFSWGDPSESLKTHPIEISYVPDPTYKGVVYSKLSIRDGHVFADGQQLR